MRVGTQQGVTLQRFNINPLDTTDIKKSIETYKVRKKLKDKERKAANAKLEEETKWATEQWGNDWRNVGRQRMKDVGVEAIMNGMDYHDPSNKYGAEWERLKREDDVLAGIQKSINDTWKIMQTKALSAKEGEILNKKQIINFFQNADPRTWDLTKVPAIKYKDAHVDLAAAMSGIASKVPKGRTIEETAELYQQMGGIGVLDAASQDKAMQTYGSLSEKQQKWYKNMGSIYGMNGFDYYMVDAIHALKGDKGVGEVIDVGKFDSPKELKSWLNAHAAAIQSEVVRAHKSGKSSFGDPSMGVNELIDAAYKEYLPQWKKAHYWKTHTKTRTGSSGGGKSGSEIKGWDNFYAAVKGKLGQAKQKQANDWLVAQGKATNRRFALRGGNIVEIRSGGKNKWTGQANPDIENIFDSEQAIRALYTKVFTAGDNFFQPTDDTAVAPKTTLDDILK